MELFKEQIARAMTKTLNKNILSTELETPPDANLGDFAYPCFKGAKEARKSPAIVASELQALLSGDSELISAGISVKAVGPYVNFTLSPHTLRDAVLKEIIKKPGEFGKKDANGAAPWIFEFSSPNVAKPFQIYHLRTTIVGSSLSKIARFLGHNTININHLGDWGTQYGILAVALDRYKDELPEKLSLQNLVDVYVRIHGEIKTDPALQKAGQDAFKRLENGDPELKALWRKCVDISLESFLKLYDQFQVHFDHFWGESHYESGLKALTDGLKTSGVAVLDQGAWIIRTNDRGGHEIPPCIIEKSDGASIYATRDLAAALYRFEKFGFGRCTYIVGKEQKLHFEQVFGALRAMGLEWENRCEHVATGLYRFKDAKMSTRKGNFVTLEEVLSLCRNKAMDLMRAREQSASLPESELNLIAEQVAIGAPVFADLSTDPTRDLDFDIDRVVSFEGETGPYLQYTHTRAVRLLEKTAEYAGFPQKSLPEHPAELLLVRRLGRFPEALERALTLRNPSQLASYLTDLASDFNVFYRECKVVMPDDEDGTRLRRTLVEAARDVLGTGLDLLGIPKPESM